MSSYNNRLQEIAYLKERVAQLEDVIKGILVACPELPPYKVYMQLLPNIYPEVTGLHTTPGTRKLTRWETFLLFFRQPRFVWKAWRHKP